MKKKIESRESTTQDVLGQGVTAGSCHERTELAMVLKKEKKWEIPGRNRQKDKEEKNGLDRGGFAPPRGFTL